MKTFRYLLLNVISIGAFIASIACMDDWFHYMVLGIGFGIYAEIVEASK